MLKSNSRSSSERCWKMSQKWQERMLKDLKPEEREAILTLTCTRWLQNFNKRLLDSDKPEQLMLQENESIIFALFQLAQKGEPQKKVVDVFHKICLKLIAVEAKK